MTAQAGTFVSDGTKMVRATSFGQALALVVAESKISYHDISNNVGATKADIKRWEAGEDHPTPAQLAKLFRTFPRLRHLASAFKVPGVAEVDQVVVPDSVMPPASNPNQIRVAGELGDLEVAAIEYGRAMRDHAAAVTRLAEARREAAAAEAEVKRLDDLTVAVFGKLQSLAGA